MPPDALRVRSSHSWTPGRALALFERQPLGMASKQSRNCYAPLGGEAGERCVDVVVEVPDSNGSLACAYVGTGTG